jgi:hypothetical protein
MIDLLKDTLKNGKAVGALYCPTAFTLILGLVDFIRGLMSGGM